MQQALVQLVWDRAASRCEYCKIPQRLVTFRFQIDHIIARKHGGLTEASNLALSCLNCNTYKGSDIAGIDPGSDGIVRFFNPRNDPWEQHFVWNGPKLVGRTAIGRATIAVLRINEAERIEFRKQLLREDENLMA